MELRHPRGISAGGCVPRFPLGQVLSRPRDLATHPEGRAHACRHCDYSHKPVEYVSDGR
jgi:hypothetical protein